MNQPFGVEISGEINVQKIIGYHGTKERFVDSIINDGFKIAPSKEGDNHWLGMGYIFILIMSWQNGGQGRKLKDRMKNMDIVTNLWL